MTTQLKDHAVLCWHSRGNTMATFTQLPAASVSRPDETWRNPDAFQRWSGKTLSFSICGGNLFFCNEKKTLEIWPFYAARPWWKQLISLKPKVPQMSSNHNMNHVTQAMSKWKRVRVYRKTGQTLLYKSWLWDTNWYEKKSHNYNISQNYEILKHNKSQNDEIIKS